MIHVIHEVMKNADTQYEEEDAPHGEEEAVPPVEATAAAVNAASKAKAKAKAVAKAAEIKVALEATQLAIKNKEDKQKKVCARCIPIHGRYMPDTYPIYARYMPDTCMIHARYAPDTYPIRTYICVCAKAKAKVNLVKVDNVCFFNGLRGFKCTGDAAEGELCVGITGTADVPTCTNGMYVHDTCVIHV